MSSSHPAPFQPLPTILDDDDEEGFDWDAAVREIDSACAASTSTSTSTSCAAPSLSGSSGLRQSRIDRFVDRRPRTGGSGGGGRRRNEDAPVAKEEAGGGGNGGRIVAAIDLEAAKTWIYPVNLPVRQYQFSISEVALFQNTLVALPTGLGKTFIAAVVMYNYLRWFPEGKIVFAAPTRPLVMQQIDACLNIVGIPWECTVDMTGLTSPPKRSKLWEAKKVFFLTPQVLEKDIQSGICPMKQIVCLVIDEAHRAKGNYAYCVVVRKVISASVHLRILALSATPGSKQQEVQKVIDNLSISRLEYRSETDLDVSPYVQNRKHELIKVPLGKDTVNVDDLLLQVIKPYVNILSSAGVLQSRDYVTMSPFQLLNSREKFRLSSNDNINPAKFQEIDGIFTTLLTIYHIRKLLSSHGIRPAYDMLDEKLKEWPFSKLRNNEFMRQAKTVMFKSLSHGAPNPKLLKMLEILAEHFKLNDPRSSRVIIFSSFRGSVRDILESLVQIGDMVKATDFIGQSSGKMSKGQNQKVQQAVLQKFRDGEYNVIVATSIGEEGLDIMEVDLVICFDANISSLRMTQRMGRTARKNAGRVAVLACEGQELNGYLKKQANSKAIRKHMYNGGSRSFSFHPSPRMVPHICKPEVQFVEVSIDRPASQDRMKKSHTSPPLKQISEEESKLIAKYFHCSQGNTPVLSLIAFPHFQAFPSRVHKVQHSFRTTLFISAVQCFHGASHEECKESSKKIVDSDFLAQPMELLALDIEDNGLRDSGVASRGITCPLGETGGPSRNSKDLTKGDTVPLSTGHNFIFDTKLVSVDSQGNVIVAPVPQLSLVKESLNSTIHMTNFEICQSVMKIHGPCLPSDSVSSPNVTGSRYTDKQGFLSCKLTTPEKIQQQGSPEPEIVPQTPHEWQILNMEDSAADMLEAKVVNSTSKMAKLQKTIDKMSDTLGNKDLNPSINHFIERGIVPESPVAAHVFSRSEDPVSPIHKHGNSAMLAKCLTSKSRKIYIADEALGLLNLPNVAEDTSSPVLAYKQSIKDNICGTPSSEVPNEEQPEVKGKCNFSMTSPCDNGLCTPNIKQAVISSSDEWQPLSKEVCASVEYVPKYKRLRKYGDAIKIPIPNEFRKEVKATDLLNPSSPVKARTSSAVRIKGQHEAKVNAMSFIDEEAEVSDDAEVSEDEGEDDDEDRYNDNFIDDKVEPTVSSTQAENSGDMIAFYRRSLLSQSPVGTPFYSACSIHDSSRIMEVGSCSSERISTSSVTPQDSTCLVNKFTAQDATGYQARSDTVGISSVTSKSSVCLLEKFTAAGHQAVSMRTAQQEIMGETSIHLNNHGIIENRKRKLSFQGPETRVLPQMHPGGYLQSDVANDATPDVEPKQNNPSTDALDDDFYMGLDFDTLEAQAAELLKAKSKPSASGPLNLAPDGCNKTEDNPSMMSIPSFDLGI